MLRNFVTTGEQQHRLFLALWPDQGTRSQLAAAARHWTHRPVPSDNLHMTLLFIGACDIDRWRCIDNAVSAVVSQPFELNIDYLGSWPRKRMQWLGTSCAPEALGELVEALRLALLCCDFQPGQQRFVPHVTLSRKEQHPQTRAGLDIIHWPVDEFVLAESLSVEGGVRYVVRKRWPLSGGE